MGQMDGNAWESYCQSLLRLRYNDYQEVPAKYGGDLGIDGLTRSGLVFQCYCPDEDPSGRELYEAQRDKIARDIAKLIKNADKIAALGAMKIREWHFLTPRYDSRELISQCRKKEKEVISKNLTAIDCNFKIFLKTDDDFIPERALYIRTKGDMVQPSSVDTEASELEMFLDSDNEIVVNIKTKLSKLRLPPDYQADLTRQLVRGYIIGQNELQILDKKYPSIYISIIQLKSANESQLAIHELSFTGNHGAVLQLVLEKYEGKLNSDFSTVLSSSLITRLATEAISDWMGRCPLQFPGLEGTNANY